MPSESNSPQKAAVGLTPALDNEQSAATNAASLHERFIDNAHYGNGTGCRCCDLVDEGHLAALLGVLQVIADATYVGNYDDGEVVAIYREWAQNALNGGPYATP